MADMKSEYSVLKKKRAKNFLEEEKEFLITLVKPYKYIIDSIKTDHMTNSLKLTTWDEISEQFNISAKTGQRSGKQLKELYGNIQKNERRNRHISVTKKEDEGIFVYDNDSNGDLNTLLNDAVPYDIHETLDIKPSTSGHETASCEDDPLVSNSTNITSERVLPPVNIYAKDHLDQNRKVIRIKRSFPRDYSDQLFQFKNQKHEKKLQILDIIKKREQVELEIKEIELQIKKKKLLNKYN